MCKRTWICGCFVFKGSRTGMIESFFLEAKLFGGLVMTGQCHMFVLKIQQSSIQPLI